jgi:hypothetical protein
MQARREGDALMDEIGGPCENTDREIWREREGDYYADSIHVTEEGNIGIDCGGYVYVKPIREWHKLAGGVPMNPPKQEQ